MPSVTGPYRPEGMSRLSGFSVQFVSLSEVQVIRFSLGKAASPMTRFAHTLTMSISSVLPVGFNSPVTSTFHGGHQSTPRSLPFSRISARQRSVPRSRYSRLPEMRIASAASNVLR